MHWLYLKHHNHETQSTGDILDFMIRAFHALFG